MLLAAAIVLAGCGGGNQGNERRDAVNAYFDRVDRAEAGLVGSSGEIDRAFRGFTLTGNSANEVHELTFARNRIASALRRVQAIDPPREARRLHADVVQLLLLQHAAAAELLAVVNYEPSFRHALAPLSPAGKALSHDIREAAKTKLPPAPTGSNVAAATAWSQGRCGNCHTLAATGSTGTNGPNLDVLQLTADEIAAKVRSGGGGMPAFAKRIAPARIDALAEFIAAEEARAAASNAVLDAYGAAFARYQGSLESILKALEALSPPSVLRPTHVAELRTLRRTAGLSGSVAAALREQHLAAANKAIRELFATAATADQAGTRRAAAAAVEAYNARLKRMATLAARITRERQRLVQQVG
jgi:mono/diheme cytochrome c family protein